jgi:thiol-disulfide isomerase/thioredoxin
LLQELLAAEAAASSRPTHQHVDIDDLLNDPDLEKLHAERLAALQQEVEKRAAMQRTGHGTYEEVAEGDFLEIVTKTQLVVVHFFHRDFDRCKILDKHFTALCQKHFATRFIKISAPDAPFFIEKLQVRTLPCIVSFIDGVAGDRIVGFEELGGKDDFTTERLENRLIKGGTVKPAPVVIDEQPTRTMRQGFNVLKQTESDEDSDFD